VLQDSAVSFPASTKNLHITDRLLNYQQLVSMIRELEHISPENLEEIPREYQVQLLRLANTI
jgi:hypothetical protein